MLIKRCDRCGREEIINSLQDKVPMYTITKQATGENAKAWDICSRCIESFDNWVKSTDISWSKAWTIPPKNVPETVEEKPEIVSEKEALSNEIRDLENKMNNAYTRGNDELGDKISERLSKKRQEKEALKKKSDDVCSAFDKNGKFIRSVSRHLKFKSAASKNAFIAKHSCMFDSYDGNNLNLIICRRKLDGLPPLTDAEKKKLKETLKVGYYDIPEKKLEIRILIRPKAFKTLEHYFKTEKSGYNNRNVIYVEK